MSLTGEPVPIHDDALGGISEEPDERLPLVGRDLVDGDSRRERRDHGADHARQVADAPDVSAEGSPDPNDVRPDEAARQDVNDASRLERVEARGGFEALPEGLAVLVEHAGRDEAYPDVDAGEEHYATPL